MKLEDRLSSALGKRGERPNILLAAEIVGSGDRVAVAQLADLLAVGKRPQQSDAIKVLYEIGERNPALISVHAADFVKLTKCPDNRLVWGALTELACICRVEPDMITENLEDILRAADKGSVIAKDQAVAILITLAADPIRADAVMPMLLRRLELSAVNQLPMYAERIAPIVPAEHRDAFRKILASRLKDDMTASKRKRIETILNRL